MGGSVFPGATVPFGMVQWSPDSAGVDFPARYLATEPETSGFSLTHLSGAGCAAFLDFPFLPLTEPLSGKGRDAKVGLDHGDEIANPGYYSVRLTSGVRVELSATTRTGIARITFPKGGKARIVMKLASPRYTTPPSLARLTAGERHVIGNRDGGGFCGLASRYKIQIAAEFDHKITERAAFHDDGLTEGAATVTGADGGLSLGFDLGTDRTLTMKIGISYVSESNAMENLRAENPAFDFDGVRSEAARRWSELLHRVEIPEGSDEKKTVLATALYHAFVHPNVFNDVNGDYRGFDDVVRRLPPGEVHYANFSGWDVYRSWAQLAALLAPKETSAFVRSLLRDADECGALPRWSLANDETGVMVGAPGEAFIANVHAFGARDFDARRALSLMVRGATEPDRRCNAHLARPGLEDYLTKGYLPFPRYEVSSTLEYAIGDAAIAAFAERLGERETAASFRKRAHAWENVFDKGTSFVRPRHDDGSWEPNFSPRSERGFVEGNATKYTFMVPHETERLAEALGGPPSLEARLDQLFTQVNGGASSPYFYIGNEPQFATPWAYAFTGAPWKIRPVVQRVMRHAFTADPRGLPGNDDLGATSAWYVWAALGLYPYVPGTDTLIAHGPSFPRMTLHVGGERAIEIRADRPELSVVRSMRLGGHPIAGPILSLAELREAGLLEFDLRNSSE